MPFQVTADAKLPWNLLFGVKKSDLSEKEQKHVERLCSSIQNTYGCTGSIYVCASKGDITARRHAGFIARMVKKGKDDAKITQYIASRHKSVHEQKVSKIDLTNHPGKGNTDAKVVVVEYACFQCPFCAYLAPKLDDLQKKYANKIVQYYKFFPVRSHKEGVPAAIAAMAAHKQGKFWPMYTLLYENRSDLQPDDLERYAKLVGLDINQWKKDISSPEVLKIIETDKLEGMRNGVNGTPTFFINGKRYDGVHTITEIEDRIAEEIDIIEGRIK